MTESIIAPREQKNPHTQWTDMAAIIKPEPWVKEALCPQTDPEAFFPEKGDSNRTAKKVCGSCDVRDQCLAFAMRNDEPFGIWGGLSRKERLQLRRNMAAVAS